MFYKNARIFTEDFQFHLGSFEVVSGKFRAVLPDAVPEDAVDLKGATVIPGLIEIHSHGNSNCDFSDGDLSALTRMAEFYLRCGITSFAPASLTLPYSTLRNAFTTARVFAENRPASCSVLRGIHMEGPFFSAAKKGAQNESFLNDPDFDAFKQLYDACGGLIRIVDVAPELPGALAFIKKARKLCTVSIAHTDADYQHAKAAVDAGVTHLTHLFNAMPGIHHRAPGVIPAAAENPNVRAELICDGIHVHPATVRLAFSMFPGRIILISDSGRCAGLAEGQQFDLGGQPAWVKDGVGKLEDGTIACSAANLHQCLCNCLSWGIPEAEAVKAATYAPACALGIQEQVGSISPGKTADFLICDSQYKIQKIYLAGQCIER